MISFKTIIERFLNKPIIDKLAVDEFILEIQKAMLMGDIPPKVVFEITNYIKENIKAERFPSKSLITKLLYEKFKEILGEEYKPNLTPRKIMLIGLYGAGKTTTAAKLWKFYSTRGISTKVISFDDERPAAKEQLKQLVRDYSERFDPKPQEMWIIDTPGKSIEDRVFIDKLLDIKQKVTPDDVYLVIGADMGKYAEKLAEGFKELGITGVIITKIDGSGKAGGAFVAVRKLGIKIVFVGYGEKIDNLSPYKPEEFLSKMFGFIDLSSIKEIKTEIIDQDIEFNFETYLNQLEMIKGKSMDEMLQSLGIEINVDQSIKVQEMMKKFRAMINSMTKEERKNPNLLKSSDSRIKRIAKGAGLKELEVRSMLNKFFEAKRMFEKVKNDKGILNLLKKIRI